MRKLTNTKRINVVAGLNLVAAGSIILGRYIPNIDVADFFSGFGFSLMLFAMPVLFMMTLKMKKTGAI